MPLPEYAREQECAPLPHKVIRFPGGHAPGRKLIPGVNDLATVYPEVAALWDKEKNGPLDPCDVLHGSTKTYWWRCPAGHGWQSQIRTLAIRGGKCPECSK